MSPTADRGANRALVLGLISMWFGVFAPFAIYSGVRSLWRIRASKGRLHGGYHATAGLIGGLIGLLVIVVGFLWWVLRA